MKNFQGYMTFVTSTCSGIELDVEQALPVEVAEVTPVNVAEDTLKAHMDDLANGSKKVNNSINHIAGANIIPKAIQQYIDRSENEKIDYEFSGISASVQCPRWVRTYIYESCDSDPISTASLHRRRLGRCVRRKSPRLSRAAQIRWRPLIKCRQRSVSDGHIALHTWKQKQ